MAKTLSQAGIETSNLVEAWHVTQSIDAFTGVEAYDITISGSLTLTGPLNAPTITGSLFGTSSWANNSTTASYVKNAQTASYIVTAQTASYVLNAVSSSYAATASYVLNAVSASYAVSSSRAVSSSYALTASYATTASYVANTFIQGGNSFGTNASLGTNDTTNLILKTSNSTRLQISSSGTVTISTGTQTSSSIGFQVTNSNSSGFFTIPFIGDTFNFSTLSQVGDTGIFGTTGEDFIVGAGNAAAWRFLGTSSLPQPGKMHTDANVGLAVSNPTYQLHLGSDSAAKPSTNTWTVSSDERLKENIELANLDICYDIVKNLPLKRYSWKDEVYTIEQVKDRNKLGWIAQDVEIVFPKAVDTMPFIGNSGFSLEDCKSLNADQIYAVMYGAVKKLIEENETLKSELQVIKTHLGI